ncbi:MAG: DUF6155 family protein [Rikenellaceae bacterium]
MSKASLKKELKSLTKEEIIDVVLELYDARKEAKEYLEFFLNPNEDVEKEKCKAVIFNEFYPKRGEPKTRFSVCRKAISDFKKLKPSPDTLADLMLFYIETGVRFTRDYGDMWEQYYDSLAGNFEKALEHISKNCDFELYKDRIHKVLEDSDCCGWGFSDSLWWGYEKYFEVEDDE